MTDNTEKRPPPQAPGSDEFLRLIIESVTDYAIISMDPRGTVTSWNEGAERLLGHSESEIVGRSGDVIFTPEDRAAGAPEEERTRALDKGRAEDERWHIRKDGSRFWGSGVMMPLTDRAVGFVKIMRDLTERQAALEQMRRNEALFRLLATNIPQLVFRSRPTGERIWASPQWEIFTGLSLLESVGSGWLDAVHAEDLEATLAAWREAQGSGEYYVEHRLRSADGEYRWHQTRAKPVDSDSDWVGTSTDVHEMHSLHDRQKVLLAELQHRTRNLLAVVQSIARQTVRRSGSLEEFGAEFEGRLRALSRVQGLLAHVDYRPVELRQLVQAELHAIGSDAAGTQRVSIEGPPVLLPATSAQTLALAIHELATNALKYGALKHPAGRLAVVWRIESGGKAPRVLLDWLESGVAMSDQAVPRRQGYGSELIERALPYQLNAETRLEFGPDGVRCRIATPIAPQEENRA